MSNEKEKQFEMIIEKIDQLLEENKQMKSLIDQKENELSLLKEHKEYLIKKLDGSKRKR